LLTSRPIPATASPTEAEDIRDINRVILEAHLALDRVIRKAAAIV
jgi:hypothetical protein